MRVTTAPIWLLCILLTASLECTAQWTSPSGEQGFLCNPPVYVNNEPDFPLTAFAVLDPKPGDLAFDVDLSGQRANDWNVDGDNVQPDLELRRGWIRFSGMRGFGDGWAAGLSIPWYRNKITGQIGGFPASGVADGFGNVTLIGRKVLWEDCKRGAKLTAALGLDLPVGADDQSFGPDNIVTNGYFNSGRRIPLGWQPSSGTFNGLGSLAYGQSRDRFAWQALVAGKVYGMNDEDVKIGNVFLAAINSTYGITRDLAGSLGFTLRSQSDDEYPNSPLPVNGPELRGTTSHSAIVYVDAALRYNIKDVVTIGIGVRAPIMHPDDGMDPLEEFSIIFYPSVN